MTFELVLRLHIACIHIVYSITWSYDTYNNGTPVIGLVGLAPTGPIIGNQFSYMYIPFISSYYMPPLFFLLVIALGCDQMEQRTSRKVSLL